MRNVLPSFGLFVMIAESTVRRYTNPRPNRNQVAGPTPRARALYRWEMRLSPQEGHARLAAHVHGVLCTLHPERGPDPQPVMYALSDDGFIGIPIDSVKPKSSTHLRREDNLAADPRAALLIEHWDPADWSRLWWVRAHVEYVADPPQPVIDDLTDRLSRTIPQYADKPFHRVLVCRIVTVSCWTAA